MRKPHSRCTRTLAYTRGSSTARIHTPARHESLLILVRVVSQRVDVELALEVHGCSDTDHIQRHSHRWLMVEQRVYALGLWAEVFDRECFFRCCVRSGACKHFAQSLGSRLHLGIHQAEILIEILIQNGGVVAANAVRNVQRVVTNAVHNVQRVFSH
jgi:hypothetical protein